MGLFAKIIVLIAVFLIMYGIYILFIIFFIKLNKYAKDVTEDIVLYNPEPELDNKIIRIDKVESKVPVYEISYIMLSKGQKKKYLITEENYLFDLIKSKELKIGDKF